MILVSELLSKPVISLYGASQVGIAANIIFDKKLKKAKFIKLFCDDEQDTEVLYIDIKHIKNLASDALAVSNKDKLLQEWAFIFDGTTNPINSSVYNIEGRLIGYIKDIELDNNTVVSLILNTNDKLLVANIVAISNDNIIYNDTDKPFKIAGPKKPKVPRNTASNQFVEVHEVQSQIDNDISLPKLVSPDNTQVSRSPASPDKINNLYSFLLGKILSKPLLDDNQKIIAHKFSTITEDTISLAKTHGRLVQLALYAD